ncbi:MAG: RagB/SusD family nutrient uptake outer membrane protein, partial [Tannerellaceae bacterium]|nr:RagB/SusD family nutrient uptake outer membrane protein [Tannerellaceae bacterium]
QGNKDLRVESNEMFHTLNNYTTRIIGGACNRGPSIQLVCSYLCTDGLPIDESPLYNPKNFWANRDPRLEYTVQPFILPDDPNYRDYMRKRANTETYLANIAAGQANYVDSLLQNKYPKYFLYGYELAPGPYSTHVLNTANNTFVVNTDSKASNQHSAYNGFVMKKYVTPEWKDYRSLGTRAYNTFPYLRWAEILMSYVEAKNELGQCTQEILDATINKVRERAYSESGLAYPRVMMSTQQKMRTIIRMERRMEFPFEGIRYRDLLRWKIAENVFNTAEYQLDRSWTGDMSGNVDLSAMTGQYRTFMDNWDNGKYPIGGVPQIDEDGLPDLSYMVTDGIQTVFYPYKFDNTKNYLWPIPADDILVNTNLTQNNGY